MFCDPVEGNIFEVDLIRIQKRQKTIITIILSTLFPPSVKANFLSSRLPPTRLHIIIIQIRKVFTLIVSSTTRKTSFWSYSLRLCRRRPRSYHICFVLKLVTNPIMKIFQLKCLCIQSRVLLFSAVVSPPILAQPVNRS